MKPSGAHGTTLPPTPTDAVLVRGQQLPCPLRARARSRRRGTPPRARWRPRTPVLRAAARPRLTSCRITVAPCSRPTSLVSSVEPSSTTMTWSSTSFCVGQGAQAPVDSGRAVERADHHAEVSRHVTRLPGRCGLICRAPAQPGRRRRPSRARPATPPARRGGRPTAAVGRQRLPDRGGDGGNRWDRRPRPTAERSTRCWARLSGADVVTTGRPQAIASSTAMPNPSRAVGKTATRAAFISA